MKKAIFTLLLLMVLVISTVNAGVTGIIDPSIYTHPELGKVWKMTITGVDSPDSIIFGNADQIKATDAGTPVQPKYDFELKTSVEEEKCSYPFTINNDRSITKIKLVTSPDLAPWDIQKKYQNCSSTSGYMTAYLVKGGLLDLPDLVCVVKDQVAIGGTVNTPKISFRSKFILTKEGGTPQEFYVSTIGATSLKDIPTFVNLGSAGQVTWTGYGTTSQIVCPIATTKYAYQEGITNAWKMGSIDKLTAYQAQWAIFKQKEEEFYNKFTQDCFLGLVCPYISPLDQQNMQSTVSILNSAADYAMYQDPLIEGKLATVSGSSNSGQAVIDLGRDGFTFNPQFTLFLKADYLQIVSLIGKPVITSLSFKACNEDADYTVNKVIANIRNEGEAESRVQASIACTSGIKPIEVLKGITLGKKGSGTESGSIEFPFTVDIASDTSMECTVKVWDQNWVQNTKQMTASYFCLAHKFCDVGDFGCQGTSYWSCVNGQKIVDDKVKKCMPEICGDNIDNNDNEIGRAHV
jgi:hypothetical protein